MTCISYYTFSGKLNFVVSKIEKAAMKNFVEEEHEEFENEELEAFDRVILLLRQTSFEFFLSKESYYCLTRFCRKVF